MRKVIGIILLIIVGLNLLSIIIRLSNGESIGSPLYLIILVLLGAGGFILANNSSSKTEEPQKKQDKPENSAL